MAMSYVSMLTGSFSTPAGDNPTVALVEAAYRHRGINARYLNCDVGPDRLGDAVRGAIAMGWRGFNCSLPHKVAVIELLDSLAESASVIGAVNCVVIDDDGTTTGHNTDGIGFLSSLREVTDPAGTAALILGAGGAARACAVELALGGAARVLIASRQAEPGQRIAADVASASGSVAEQLAWTPGLPIPAGIDVVVNATSVGMAPHADAIPDVDLDTITPAMVVADVVASPPQTRFIAAAADRGATTLTGTGMLVNQAVEGIRLWTGMDVDPSVMLAVAEEIAAGQ